MSEKKERILKPVFDEGCYVVFDPKKSEFIDADRSMLRMKKKYRLQIASGSYRLVLGKEANVMMLGEKEQ